MRQKITVICAVALLIYAGLVLEQNQRQADLPARPEISTLERALQQAGGLLDGAQFILAAPITDPALPGRVRERLGWTGAVPLGEKREARLYTQHGMYYLALDWRMTGERAARWAENHATLSQLLAEAGVSTPIHVQLEGRVAAKAPSLLDTANTALDGVAAQQRQPWAGDRSASVAGRSAHLPGGPHEVNVQAAARQTVEGVRLWVAWPALTGDY